MNSLSLNITKQPPHMYLITIDRAPANAPSQKPQSHCVLSISSLSQTAHHQVHLIFAQQRSFIPRPWGPVALLSRFQNDCHSFLTHLPHHPVWPTPDRFGYFCLSHLPKMLLNIQSPYLKAIDWPSNTHRVKFQQTNCVKYKALHKTEPIFLSPSFVLSPLHKHKVPNYSLSIPNTLLCPNSVPFYMQVSPWREHFSFTSW